MIRKIIFLFALSLIFGVSTIFSQQKTTDFLGTWKLTDASFKSLYGLGDTTMTVSETGGKLVVERKGEKTKNAVGEPYIQSYRVDGKTDISLTDSPYAGGVRYRRMRFVKQNKLQFLTTYKSVDTEHLERITWILSEDGKTLTVKQALNKLIFTKQ